METLKCFSLNKTGVRPVSRLQLQTGLPHPYCKIEKEEEGGYGFCEDFRSTLGAQRFFLGALIAELWYNFGNSFGDKGKQKDALTSK